jgi:hypothetical protein
MMKKAMVMVLFVLSCGLAAVAQKTQTFGAWTVYPPVTRHGDSLILVQSTFLVRDSETQSGPRMLKLDAICRNGKLYRVALETGTPIAKRTMNFSAAVPTTRISFRVGDSNLETEKWAVFDSGRTLSPYHEIRQQAMNRIWMERLSAAENLALEYEGDAQEEVVRANFDTTGVTEALEAVGCSYE